jgi:hypothetical protein
MNNKQTVPTDQRNKWGDDNTNKIIDDAAIDYLKKVKSPALYTSWQQFDMDIFKAGVEWQKEQSEKQWTDKDMESAWKQAEGKLWDEEHGYYSPDFEEWLAELKQEKLKENE